jgi:hypothetical protein
MVRQGHTFGYSVEVTPGTRVPQKRILYGCEQRQQCENDRNGHLIIDVLEKRDIVLEVSTFPETYGTNVQSAGK